MKDQIMQLFNQAQKEKISLRELSNQIKIIPGAQAWIDENCDPNLSNRFIAKKIYSALHNRFKFSCIHNNPIYLNERYFVTYPKATRHLCNCYEEFLKSEEVLSKKAMARKKYEQTMIKKYGTVGTLNNSKIKEKFQKTNLQRYGTIYSAQNKEVHNKKISTCLDRFGVEYPIQNITISNKIKKTNLEKYGTEFVLASLAVKQKIKKQNADFNHPTQRHISSESARILNDKELFKQALMNSNVLELANELKVSESYIQKIHQKFELNILQPNSSSYETEIKTWLESLGVTFIQHEKKLIHPCELDFYLLEHRLAIEFNGLYWHSEQQGKIRQYHRNKTDLCMKKDIQLIHIFEDEWLNHKDICKSIILGYLNKLPTRIYARKCEIKVLSNKEIRQFLSSNHLQGYVAGKVNLALIYNNEIVAALTFGKPRYSKNVEWELLRLCSKVNVQIPGGIQKLWKYFSDNYPINNIVSYCDRRWFNGNIYAKLGFVCNEISKPTYWYTDYKQRFHRSKYQKHKLVNMGYDKNLTEAVITKDILGLDRIWDCGQDSWKLGK